MPPPLSSPSSPKDTSRPSLFPPPTSPQIPIESKATEKVAEVDGLRAHDLPLPPSTPRIAPPSAKEISAQALIFFTTASSPTLAAVLAAIAGLLCLIFGRLGILAIGVVLGVLGHATLQDRPLPSFESLKKTSDDALALLSPSKEISYHEDDAEEDLSALPPKTAAAVSELSNAMIRNYVGSWYTHIVPMESAFPASCHQHLIKTVLRISSHLSSKRPVDIFMLFVYSTSNTFIVFFRELSAALSTSSASEPTIPSYVAQYPNSALAVLLDRNQQKRRIHTASIEVINQFMEPELRKCEPLFVFMREILKNVVFETVIEKVSDADYINTWIISMLEETNETSEVQEGVGDIFREFDRGVAGAAKGKVFTTETLPPEKPPRKRLSKSEEDSEKAKKEALEMTRLLEETERRMAEETNNLHDENSPIKNGHARSESLHNSNQKRASSEQKADDISSAISAGQAVEDDYYDEIEGVPTTAASSVEAFTTFDKLPAAVVAEPKIPQSISFLRAYITITDMAPPSNPPKILKSRPTQPFMIQIEPQGAAGWIIMRTYAEFEQVHEVLRRVALISGASRFQMAYGAEGLPTWKGRASDEVGSLLELYLRIVVSEETLVETDALRRFLERDEEKKEKPGAGWPKTSAFKNMGGNVLGAITKAPQTATEGSKALLGNVFNAVGGVTLKRSNSSQTVPTSEADPSSSPAAASRPGIFGMKRPGSTDSFTSLLGLGGGGGQPATNGNGSQNLSPETSNRRNTTTEGRRTPLSFMRSAQESEDEKGDEEHKPPLPTRHSGDATGPPLPTRPSLNALNPPLPSRPAVVTGVDQGQHHKIRPRTSSLRALSGPFCESPATLGDFDSINGTNVVEMRLELSLPPPPSEIDDDYGSSDEVVVQKATAPARPHQQIPVVEKPAAVIIAPAKKEHEKLTEQETQFVVDIFFSLISELYTLSSAWSLRRSLLNIAKTVLLRPGNASLVAIRTLIQENVIDSNTNDEVIADLVKKLRQSSLSTEAETKQWQEEGLLDPPSEEKREETRKKARALIGERGLPEGLKGLMGGMASRECMEVVFDSLQDPDVARGIMVSLIIDALRGICN